MPQNLNQVPPNLEVWTYGRQTYLVRIIPDTEPPIPLAWKVESAERYQALGIKKADRVFASPAEFWSTGALLHGSTIELHNTTEDPWDQIQTNYETEVRVKPWLADPEILGIWFGAALEGRGITEAELQGTDWWRNHSEAERSWIAQNAQDPASADRLISDNRTRVADMFRAAGVSNATEGLINKIADNWTTGAWSQIYATKQVELLADPNASGSLDSALRAFRPGLDTTRQGEDQVRQMIQTWLGPAASKNWSEDHIAKWASRLREDPDARMELETNLRNHRLALFPEYENENLTYEDIAAPWRGVWSSMLGQTPDESDPTFTKIIRLNDRSQAESLLRKKGRADGNAQVVQEMLSGLGVFGNSVRRSDPAVL